MSEQTTQLHRPRAAVRLSVPFEDLDAMQVVWHGNYFRYFERARQALFDQVGLDIYRWGSPEGGCYFPVVRTRVKYLHPLRHRDVFECSARVLEARAHILLEFQLRLLPDGPLCAWAQAEHVAVRADDLKPIFTVPDEVRRALGEEP